MAQNNTARKTAGPKATNINKLSEKQQAFVKECIARNPWIEEKLKGGHLVHTFKFRYDNGTVEKTVFIPERWGMSQEFEPVTDDDYIIPDPSKDSSKEAKDSKEKKSSDKKEEKGEEKKESMLEKEVKRGVLKYAINLVCGLIITLIVLACSGGSLFKQQAYTTGLINTMNRGFVDMDCDGIPDENWDKNDANLQRHLEIVETQKHFQR